MEKIVQTKTCKQCSTSFDITDKDLEFYEKVSPVFGGKRYSIPSPTLCPDCRFQLRQSFINERNLYKRKCDFSGKEIVSNYSLNKGYKVYENSIWLSPDCENLKYGRDFDFSKTFFEQFNELLREVPRMSLDQGVNMINSIFNNYVDNLKDCYSCVNTEGCESCYYSSNITDSYRCMDCNIGNKNNECYECISCKNSYKLYFSQNCNDCSESMFLKNCENCQDCLLSVNLVNKKYHIFNKEFSREDYFIEKEKILNKFQNNKKELLKEFNKFVSKNIAKYANIVNSENCSGDYITNSKNCKECYLINNSENLAFSLNTINSVNAHDSDGFGIEKSYYTVVTGGKSYNCLFCIAGRENCNNLIYCDYCFFNCSNLFGCVGLKNKQYCILNKQYTKEEYEELIPKIIEHMKSSGEWGEFFPVSISPFGYNETVANEYFLLEKEEAIKKGFNWSDYEAPFPKVEKIIPADKLPDDIKDIPDDILNWAIECEVTKKPFRIIAQELEFYRKHNLPTPRRHPDQRHLDRMALRNPRKLYDGTCDKCGKEIKTTYAPEREEIVYCEECYNKEIY